MDAKSKRHAAEADVTELVAKEKRALESKLKKFTGTALTLVYNPHPQGFADYSVATFQLKDGTVEKVEVSDRWGADEARARLEIAFGYLLEKMRRNYPSEYQHV